MQMTIEHLSKLGDRHTDKRFKITVETIRRVFPGPLQTYLTSDVFTVSECEQTSLFFVEYDGQEIGQSDYNDLSEIKRLIWQYYREEIEPTYKGAKR